MLELEGTVDPGIFSAKVVPVRTVNSIGPWIRMWQGLGVGLSLNETWPYAQSPFLFRLEKAAAVNSQSQVWQDLRTRHGFRYVDLTVEYWRDFGGREATWVVRRSSATIEALMLRQHPQFDPDVDLHDLGDAEAKSAMADLLARIEDFAALPLEPRGIRVG